MNRTEFRTSMIELVTFLITTIGDEYRSSTSEPNDETASMDLTIGADNDGWSYQTGDNSYTGGAYSYASRLWAVVTLDRDSKPEDVADDIISQLDEDDSEPPTFDAAE